VNPSNGQRHTVWWQSGAQLVKTQAKATTMKLYHALNANFIGLWAWVGIKAKRTIWYNET